MRAERERWSGRRTLALFVLFLPACGVGARLTRPEGDGGWSAARRERELGQLATAAGVAYPVGDAEPAATAAVPAAPLTLSAALALAARSNRRIGEAERTVAGAGQRVRTARGRLLPATTGSGRYTWYTDAQAIRVDAPPGLGSPGAITTREAEVGGLNGTVTLPVDLSGELGQALAAAQAGYRGEKARLWATTLAEQALVVRSFFQLLEARRLREVTEQTIVLQRRQLGNAESRFTSGRLTKNELLVVQVALRNAEQQLVQRDLAIAEARWTLNQAIGLAVDAPTEVTDVGIAPDVPAVDQALRLAYATNPVLVSLLEEQQRLDATARSLARSRLPRVAGGGAIDYTTSEVVEPQHIGSGFVGFTWDLGTDTRREADIAEARIAAERNRITIERELRALEAAVRRTQRATEERLAARSTAQTAVGQAEENLRIREQQFDAGRAASDDVLEAEAILAAERATLATALYQAHARRAELQQLMGLSLEEAVPEAP